MKKVEKALRKMDGPDGGIERAWTDRWMDIFRAFSEPDDPQPYVGPCEIEGIQTRECTAAKLLYFEATGDIVGGTALIRVCKSNTDTFIGHLWVRPSMIRPKEKP